MIVTDRGKSYGAEELAEVPQQECMAHILHNVTKVLEDKLGSARFRLKLEGLVNGQYRPKMGQVRF